ncbi:MAG: hypothetical protein LBS65_01175 [Desulfovibrio sp.]|nr:hypothetical protein [Desulfovibrio sp.]
MSGQVSTSFFTVKRTTTHLYQGIADFVTAKVRILTQSAPFENGKNNIYLVEDTELEDQYKSDGYRRYERVYKVKYAHKEYTVTCPEYRNDAKEPKTIVIIPAFLLPGRPYPVEIYLHAIDLYSRAPERGQRWAAEETRKRFGLETFAHTTLGRAMRAFVRKMEEPGMPREECGDGKEASGEGKPPSFPTKQSTRALRERAASLLQGLPPWVDRREAAEFCHRLAIARFKEYRRFLL